MNSCPLLTNIEALEDLPHISTLSIGEGCSSIRKLPKNLTKAPLKQIFIDCSVNVFNWALVTQTHSAPLYEEDVLKFFEDLPYHQKFCSSEIFTNPQTISTLLEKPECSVYVGCVRDIKTVYLVKKIQENRYFLSNTCSKLLTKY